jgi:hypothetical protein
MYSPAVKRSGRGVDHPPQSSAEVKESVELYLYSHSGFSWQVTGLTLPFETFSNPKTQDYPKIEDYINK